MTEPATAPQTQDDVTGSARGIGRATAALLAEHGARVLIADLDRDVAQQAASELGGDTAVFAGDLTQDGVPDALVQKRRARGGRGRRPHAVKRLAVRFSAPLLPGETVTTRVWRANGSHGFESLNGEGKAVIKDGLVEVR